MTVRPWPLPLRWKLVLVSAAVLTSVIAVFGSVLYADLSAAQMDTIAAGLQTSTRTVIGQEVHESFLRAPAPSGSAPQPRPPQPRPPRSDQEVLPPTVLRDDPSLFQRIAADLTNPNVAARILDLNGQTLANGASAARFPTPILPAPNLALLQEVISTEQPRHLRVPTTNGPVLVELIPLLQPGGAALQPVGVLQLATSLDTATALLERLRALLISGTLLGILATVTLTTLLIRAVLQPLRRMTATSRAIAEGDLGRRVAVPAGGDELTELAQAFNHMVARLETLLVAQRRFLADASHELRTPLTALSGGMEMLLLPDADPAARARLIRLLRGETARMGRLVDGLLTLTRLDMQGKDALTIRPVDLSSLAGQVVDETRLLAPDLDIELDLPEIAPVAVPGDADRLHQVLLNLTTNARAHTRSPGRITVGVRRQGNSAVLSVADTGAGIAPEALAHVWDRLYRTDPSRQRQAGQGGLGLGLAIVRAIVESHGGTAEIVSTLGVGTTVTVTLPGAMLTTSPAGVEASSSPRRLPVPR